MYMKLKDGKSKVLTLSYDDGVVQDARLIQILDRYGIKGTFNLNTALYFAEDMVREKPRGKLKLSEAQALYQNSGHEVALHFAHHPFPARLRAENVMTEVLQNRSDIESQYKTLARGMAYPNGSYNQLVMDILKLCGICYARTTKSTESFRFPENWLALDPTCHHNNPRLMALAKDFAETPFRPGCHSENRLFYLWGHSYEFDNDQNWDRIEAFAEYMGGREDVWYATNIELYDYVKAYEALHTSVDNRMVHNPSSIDVWFWEAGEIHCIKGGQTLYL